jgi:hypothetical protein
VFAGPEVGETEEIVDGGTTVKVKEFDGPPCVTMTGPVAALAGTGTTICVLLQLAGVAAVPLKVSVPAVEPKFVPVTVTDVPAGAVPGEMLLILGAGIVNAVPLLASPALVVTIMLPLVASGGTEALMLVVVQEATVASVPLNFTVPVPCGVPKLLPVIVTGVPAAPDKGAIELTDGGDATVNVTPLLETPPAVTITEPVVAADGTVVTMEVSLQLDTVAVTPLNFTVPVERPKAVPAMVTDPPAGPDVGVRVFI